MESFVIGEYSIDSLFIFFGIMFNLDSMESIITSTVLTINANFMMPNIEPVNLLSQPKAI